MFWNRLRDRLMDPGELARRQHSRWLTDALESGDPFPRIPTRRADAGGFGKLLSLPSGRETAERWWRAALARVPESFDR